LFRRGQPRRATGLQPLLRLAQLVLQAADPFRPRLEARGAGRVAGPVEGFQPAADQRVRAGAGHGLDPPGARSDAPLRGDQEAADLAARPAVRAAAQLEGVVLDADRPDGLAVLLVEERVRPALDRLGHAHERDGDGPVLADDAADTLLDPAAPG